VPYKRLLASGIRHSAGDGQWALPVGYFHLRGVYIHIITPEDVHSLSVERKAEAPWVSCARWLPQYEVDPHT